MTNNNINNRLPLLFLPLVSLIAGITWQRHSFFSTFTLATGIMLTLLAIAIYVKKKIPLKQLQIITLPLFFFGGAFLLQQQFDQKTVMLNWLKDKPLDLIAYVADKTSTPEDRIKETLLLHIKQPANFTLQYYIHYPTWLKVGDTIKLKNVTITPPGHKPTLSGNPTFADYLVKQNILATVFKPYLKYKKVNRPTLSFARWAWHKKNSLLKRIKAKLSTATSALFSSIFLGNKKNCNLDIIKNAFGYWGISHYLARSGLHIVLFILLWKFLLGLAPMHLYIKKILLLLICISYLVLSWASLSFLRAFYIFVLYEIGKLCNKQIHFLHLLTLICLGIVIMNPIQIFFLDFQLSFGLTFSLAYAHQKIILLKK